MAIVWETVSIIAVWLFGALIFWLIRIIVGGIEKKNVFLAYFVARQWLSVWDLIVFGMFESTGRCQFWFTVYGTPIRDFSDFAQTHTSSTN